MRSAGWSSVLSAGCCSSAGTELPASCQCLSAVCLSVRVVPLFVTGGVSVRGRGLRGGLTRSALRDGYEIDITRIIQTSHHNEWCCNVTVLVRARVLMLVFNFRLTPIKIDLGSSLGRVTDSPVDSFL